MQAIDRDTGETVYITRDDVPTEQALMERVRASTSYPIVLPPTVVDGRALYDGGIGRGGGIMVPRAMDDGLSRFFVVCTRPRGFRRPLKPNRFYDAFFWRHPRMREALDTWNRRYDAELDRLDRLEAEGRAYVFFVERSGREEHRARRGEARAQLRTRPYAGFIRIRQVGAVSLRAGGLSFQTPPRARIR